MKKISKLFLASNLLMCAAFAPNEPIEMVTKSDTFKEYLEALNKVDTQFASKPQLGSSLIEGQSWKFTAFLVHVSSVVAIQQAIAAQTKKEDVIKKLEIFGNKYFQEQSFSKICKHIIQENNLDAQYLHKKREFSEKEVLKVTRKLLGKLNEIANGNQKQVQTILQNTKNESTHLNIIPYVTQPAFFSYFSLPEDLTSKAQNALPKIETNVVAIQFAEKLGLNEDAKLHQESNALDSTLAKFWSLERTNENFAKLELMEGVLQLHIYYSNIFSQALEANDKVSAQKWQTLRYTFCGSIISAIIFLAIVIAGGYIVLNMVGGVDAIKSGASQTKTFIDQINNAGGIKPLLTNTVTTALDGSVAQIESHLDTSLNKAVADLGKKVDDMLAYIKSLGV